MDLILIIAVIVGLVMRQKARNNNSKNAEHMGDILAGGSALLLIVIWIHSCMKAMP